MLAVNLDRSEVDWWQRGVEKLTLPVPRDLTAGVLGTSKYLTTDMT